MTHKTFLVLFWIVMKKLCTLLLSSLNNKFQMCKESILSVSKKLLTNCDVNMVCTVILRKAVKATPSGGQSVFFYTLPSCESNNFMSRLFSMRLLRLVKCVIADVITLSHVGISRQCT